MIKNRLFILREYNNMYQSQISKQLNITQQSYSLWERGTTIIPLKHLNTISNIFDVSLDYILGLSSKKKPVFLKQITTLNSYEIGMKVKKIREDNNLTLRSLAKELNTTSSTISAYESGKILILTAFAYEICLKYDYSLDWLCGKSNIKKRTNITAP